MTKITSVKITLSTGKTPKKPRVGDVRVTKKHGTQVRVQAKGYDAQGRVIGDLFKNGKPLFKWQDMPAAFISY